MDCKKLKLRLGLERVICVVRHFRDEASCYNLMKDYEDKHDFTCNNDLFTIRQVY